MVQNNTSNPPINHPLVIFFYYNNIHSRLVPNTGSNQNNTQETSCCPSNKCNNKYKNTLSNRNNKPELTKDQDDLVTTKLPRNPLETQTL